MQVFTSRNSSHTLARRIICCGRHLASIYTSLPIPQISAELRLQISLAKCVRSIAPCVFHELSEGDFRFGSSYGTIERTHFSRLAVIIKWRLGRPIPFNSSIYYTPDDRASFVVTQNLAAHISVSSIHVYFEYYTLLSNNPSTGC